MTRILLPSPTEARGGFLASDKQRLPWKVEAGIDDKSLILAAHNPNVHFHDFRLMQ